MPNEDNRELIQYLDTKFEEVNKNFKEVKEDIRENGNKIDKATGLYLKQEKESASMGKAVRRNERNIAKLADTTGTEIEKD